MSLFKVNVKTVRVTCEIISNKKESYKNNLFQVHDLNIAINNYESQRKTPTIVQRFIDELVLVSSARGEFRVWDIGSRHFRYLIFS